MRNKRGIIPTLKDQLFTPALKDDSMVFSIVVKSPLGDLGVVKESRLI